MDWMMSRTVVGNDRFGNVYYIEHKGNNQVKRMVKYKELSSTSMDQMPRAWCRPDPPTHRELEIDDKKADELRRKVQILEEEDAKERVRQYAGRNAGAAEETQQERISRLASTLMGGKATSVASVAEKKKNTFLDGTEPTLNEDDDPQGVGDGFQPGSWQPASKSKRRPGR